METKAKNEFDVEVELEYLKLDKSILSDLVSPFERRTEDDLNNPHLHLLRLMRDPDYFYFTCKHLFGIQLAPFQCVILKELWNRPFPMLIGSRGASKCVGGDSWVITQNGFRQIGNIVGNQSPKTRKYEDDLRLLGENGFNDVEYSWNNGVGKTIKLTTRHGYELEMTPNHPVRVVRNGTHEWVNAEDIKESDYLPIDRSETWFENTNDITPDEGYALGLMIGDGCMTQPTMLSFTTADPELIQPLTCLTGKSFKKVLSSKFDYRIYGKHTVSQFHNKYGTKPASAGDKTVPDCILSASKLTVAAFISGYFDTDGTAGKRSESVRACSKSKTLLQTVQFLLLRFGIVSRLKACLNKTYNTYYYHLSIYGGNARLFGERIGFRLNRKQSILTSHNTKKHNPNVDIIPNDLAYDALIGLHTEWSSVRPSSGHGYDYERNLLTPHRTKDYQLTYTRLNLILNSSKEASWCQEWQQLDKLNNSHYFYDRVSSISTGFAETFDVHMKSDDDRSFISNGFISHNSFLLGLYAVLRATFFQGSKVVITGSGFRQAKTVFMYCEKFWNDSPILQSLMKENKKSGAHHDADRWRLIVGESMITSLPIGDGCVSGDSQTTYGDHFGTISENATSSTVRQTSNVQVWGNGKFRDTDEAYNNGIKQTKIIRTKQGFYFEGTHNHRMKVARNGYVDWVRSDEMKVGDRILIDRSWRWHDGNEPMTDAEAYSLGAMLGNGNYTNIYHLGFATCYPDHFIPILSEGLGKRVSPSNNGIYWHVYGKQHTQSWLNRWEMKLTYAIDKTLPAPILRANRGHMTACLQGLFDTDGHVLVSTAKGGTSVSVTLTSTSKKLLDQVQYILLHYGIISHVDEGRNRHDNWNTAYNLMISGVDAELFSKHIGFKLPRKQNELLNGISAKSKSLPFDDTIPNIKTDSKTNKVRNLLDPSIYYDEITSIEDGECETFDIHVPEEHEYCTNGFFSHNTKIRGERANVIICDEFASLSREIFETVIAGFGVVNLSPIEQAKHRAKIRVLKKKGLWTKEMAETDRKSNLGNQIIISGTAYYQFNHFYEYYKRWKQIIHSKGDKKLLFEAFNGEVPDDFEWRDYSIIRLPVELLPEGYMDQKQIDRSKASIHSSIFESEFSAIFPNDSNGFFKRLLIESCVTNKPVVPNVPGAEPIQFKAIVKGRSDCKYVYGIDPASEQDRFSIIVLEIHEDHRRVVYCWTTKKQEYKLRAQGGSTDQTEYYGYCARKIRDLMRVFPTDLIAIDTQGGGHAVFEALQDKDKLNDDEVPLYAITPDHPLSDGKERITDNQAGLHILVPISFAKSEWIVGANHGLRKDLEDRVVLFPMYDTVVLETAFLDDQKNNRVFDTLDDCVWEIEELKDELATIVHTQTPNTLRDHWDTPEVKVAGGKKGRMRKDRYSSLLMANDVARRVSREPEKPIYHTPGGFANSQNINLFEAPAKNAPKAPSWWLKTGGQGGEGCGWVR